MENAINEGYIPLPRRIFEHEYWNEKRVFSRFEALLDIIESARYKPGVGKMIVKNKIVEVSRGEWVASYRFLAKRWKWSTKKVSKYLEILSVNNTINIVKTLAGTKLQLLNYERYNKGGQNGVQQNPQQDYVSLEQGNTKVDSKETVRKQQGNKEVSKVNNVNKERSSSTTTSENILEVFRDLLKPKNLSDSQISTELNSFKDKYPGNFDLPLIKGWCNNVKRERTTEEIFSNYKSNQ